VIVSLTVLPLVLLAIGTPVFLVFLTAVTMTILFFLPVPPIALQQVLFGGLDNYALLAIPFFVFAGELMSTSGIAHRLINWAMAMVGRVPGSLGIATVGASTAIGAISGSSVAAVAALGKTLYPKLVASGYGKERAGGLLASSGAIDIVIPPSIAMILYGPGGGTIDPQAVHGRRASRPADGGDDGGVRLHRRRAKRHPERSPL
jgi:C4-dicarboxylate transporter DctM subunit